MNPSNPRLPDKKAANRAVAPKSAIAIKSVIVTNKAVAAEEPSAINRAVEANRGVAVKSAANKAADDKLRRGTAKALVIVPWINERREGTPAVFLPGGSAVYAIDTAQFCINARHRKPNLISVTA